jgi:hypothetical protein
MGGTFYTPVGGVDAALAPFALYIAGLLPAP